MKKYDPGNERVKREYAFYLAAANGKQDASIDAALRAIERFELSTGREPFSKFHIEQARAFPGWPTRRGRTASRSARRRSL